MGIVTSCRRFPQTIGILGDGVFRNIGSNPTIGLVNKNYIYICNVYIYIYVVYIYIYVMYIYIYIYM